MSVCLCDKGKSNNIGKRKGSQKFALKVQASSNVMAHAQKPDFVFRRNGRVHLNRPAGASVRSTTGSLGVRHQR